MNTGVVSVRYAKALLAYAKAQGKAEQVYEEVGRLSRCFLQLPRLQRAIDNPVLPVGDKLRLLQEAAGGENVSQELLRFFRLVIDEKRENFLPFMAVSYCEQFQQDRHVLVGRLTTAVPSPALARKIEQLAARRTHADVQLQTETDPSLIGGFVLRLDGYCLDASVSRQLKRVEQQFIDKNRRIV